MESFILSDENIKIDNFKMKNRKKEFINYILEKLIEADQRNQCFEMVFTSYSKGYYLDGIRTEKKNESLIKAKMILKRPMNVLLEVIESPKDIAIGSTLLYTGGNKVKVKARGILGLIPVTFSINDPMFSDTRNNQILTMLNTIERITNKSTNIDLEGTGEINGREIYILRVNSVIKPDSEITHEIYGVDSETFIIILNEMYIGNELVSQYKVESIKTDLNLPKDFFKL